MTHTTTAIVMGVSGSGKTTLALGLAQALGWEYAEGDDFHPEDNVARMRAGIPLSDDDRWPWLRALATWIGAREADRQDAIVTCSALRRAYRDVLRDGHPSVVFVHVEVPARVVAERLDNRAGHFMPAALLPSQLATLEPLGEDEPGVVIDGDGWPAEVLARAVTALRRR